MDKTMNKSATINKLITKELLALGAVRNEPNPFPYPSFKIFTKAGSLQVSLSGDRPCRAKYSTISVYSRFENPDAASKLVNCNPYSGKWNWVSFACTYSAKDFVATIIQQIKSIL